MNISNITFNSSCSPEKYLLTFNGSAALLDPSGTPTSVTFNALTSDVDDSGSDTIILIGGGMTSSCFGGAVSLTTAPALSVAYGDNCPSAGKITVSAQSQVVGHVIFNADQSVGLDTDGDGIVDPPPIPNCLDPRLLECAA